MHVPQDFSTARGAGKWLHAAATPVFAAMALLTAVNGSPAGMLCTASQGMPALGGMTLMYVLMAVLHAGPWLGLLRAPRRRQR